MIKKIPEDKKNEEISKTKSLRLQMQEKSSTVSESEIMYRGQQSKQRRLQSHVVTAERSSEVNSFPSTYTSDSGRSVQTVYFTFRFGSVYKQNMILRQIFWLECGNKKESSLLTVFSVQ